VIGDRAHAHALLAAARDEGEDMGLRWIETGRPRHLPSIGAHGGTDAIEPIAQPAGQRL
jgi:hypothetical protein